MMRYFLLVVLILGCGMSAPAVPVPPPGKPKDVRKPAPAVPDLEGMLGKSNWGDFTQIGRKFSINNHPMWFATGEILPSGVVILVWYMRDRLDEPCPGSYLVVDGELVGKWGYESHGASLDREGALVGVAGMHDRIYRMPARVE